MHVRSSRVDKNSSIRNNKSVIIKIDMDSTKYKNMAKEEIINSFKLKSFIKKIRNGKNIKLVSLIP